MTAWLRCLIGRPRWRRDYTYAIDRLGPPRSFDVCAWCGALRLDYGSRRHP